MGFSAVARVTEKRWIACLVEDRIDFGLDPGDELKIHETICDEIRDSGEAVVFDDASDDIKWSRHPVPVIYGFKSYCSFPVYLDDGSFFGTLCAIDPGAAPRRRRGDRRDVQRLCARKSARSCRWRCAKHSPPPDPRGRSPVPGTEKGRPHCCERPDRRALADLEGVGVVAFISAFMSAAPSLTTVTLFASSVTFSAGMFMSMPAFMSVMLASTFSAMSVSAPLHAVSAARPAAVASNSGDLHIGFPVDEAVA